MGEIITLNGKGAKTLKPAFKVLGRKKKGGEGKRGLPFNSKILEVETVVSDEY